MIWANFPATAIIPPFVVSTKGISECQDPSQYRYYRPLDHGKTPWWNKLLHQAGSFAAHQHIAERVMVFRDIERERALPYSPRTVRWTTRACISILWIRPAMPTSAARWNAVLSMVDGVLLLVDASRAHAANSFCYQKSAGARIAPDCGWSTRSIVPARVRTGW